MLYSTVPLSSHSSKRKICQQLPTKGELEVPIDGEIFEVFRVNNICVRFRILKSKVRACTSSLPAQHTTSEAYCKKHELHITELHITDAP